MDEPDQQQPPAAADAGGADLTTPPPTSRPPSDSDPADLSPDPEDPSESDSPVELELELEEPPGDHPGGRRRSRLRVTDQEGPESVGLPGLSPDNAGPGAAAFFDVDNTIMRGSSFAVLAKGMADRDYFTTGEVLDFTWKQLKFIVSGRENMHDITAATENGLAFVRGREPAEIETLADEVYDERMVDRLWAGTIGLARAHMGIGHEVWLISATPVEVSRVLARRLGLTGGLGTIAEVIDGEYTGRLQGVPLHGGAKAEAVQRLAAERNLDLSRCAAYSDSSNDVPMLSCVGFPVAVNPDGRLRGIARENGWPVVDHRIRGRESVRKGVPAAAAAGLVAGAAVGVAKAIAIIRDPGRA